MLCATSCEFDSRVLEVSLERRELVRGRDEALGKCFANTIVRILRKAGIEAKHANIDVAVPTDVHSIVV